MISIRRFWLRLVDESLGTSGRYSAKPAAPSIAGATPLDCRYLTTLVARAVESAQLSSNPDFALIGTSSVYPETTTFLLFRSLKASATASSAALPCLLSEAEAEEKRILSLSLTVILPRSSEISTCPLAICCSSELASCWYCALFASSAPFSSWSFFDASAASLSCWCSRVFCCCTSASFFSSAAAFSLSCWYFCRLCRASRCWAENSSFETPHPTTAMQSAGSILFTWHPPDPFGPDETSNAYHRSALLPENDYATAGKRVRGDRPSTWLDRRGPR